MNSHFYRNGRYLVLDFETTSLAKGSPLVPENRLLLACGLDWTGQRMHCFGGEMEQAGLLRRLESVDFLVAHNAKFELGWLRRCGADLYKLRVFDTQIAQKVLAANRPWPLSLEAVAAHYQLPGKSPFVKGLIHAGIDPSTISRRALLAYCANDVALTAQIFRKQLALMDDAQLALLQTRCELTPVLADIERHGLRVDKELITQERIALLRQLGQLTQRLTELAPGVLLTSAKQTAAFIYDVLKVPELCGPRGHPLRTPGGARVVDMATLGKLRPPSPEAKEFIELRLAHSKVNAALVKYITKLDTAAQGTARVFAQFNQTTTKTDRLSSTGLPPANIQFQNMDRDYKRLFVPRPGFLYLEADASQLEFRIAVDVAQDKNGLAAIQAKQDVHQDTAKVLAGNAWATMSDEARRKLRTESKAHTFRPLYGGRSGTAREKAYYKWFQEQYAGIYSMQQGWVGEAIREKRIRLPWGARYYFPDAVPDAHGYVPCQSQIFNYPIQALATAEIVPIIVRGIWRDMQGLKSRLVNTVHDSVLIETAPDELEIVKKIVVDNFTQKVYTVLSERYQYRLTVPLSVEIKIGDHWGEGESATFTRAT